MLCAATLKCLLKDNHTMTRGYTVYVETLLATTFSVKNGKGSVCVNM